MEEPSKKWKTLNGYRCDSEFNEIFTLEKNSQKTSHNYSESIRFSLKYVVKHKILGEHIFFISAQFEI